jgi:hypothetical protein
MPEESTPDLAELVRQALEAVNRHDLGGAVMLAQEVCSDFGPPGQSGHRVG